MGKRIDLYRCLYGNKQENGRRTTEKTTAQTNTNGMEITVLKEGGNALHEFLASFHLLPLLAVLTKRQH